VLWKACTTHSIGIGEERCNHYTISAYTTGSMPMVLTNQHKPSHIVSEAQRILYAQRPEDVAQCLCQRRHDDDPGVGFASLDGLERMDANSEPKEDSEED
jgi:hypothetical protein